jgi:hypothetical protein
MGNLILIKTIISEDGTGKTEYFGPDENTVTHEKTTPIIKENL